MGNNSRATSWLTIGVHLLTLFVIPAVYMLEELRAITHAGVVSHVIGAVHSVCAARWEPFRPGDASLTWVDWQGSESELIRFARTSPASSIDWRVSRRTFFSWMRGSTRERRSSANGSGRPTRCNRPACLVAPEGLSEEGRYDRRSLDRGHGRGPLHGGRRQGIWSHPLHRRAALSSESPRAPTSSPPSCSKRTS